MRKTCLNCETPLHGVYCHKCGQKGSTHRITFSKFIQHDLLHGVFHLDKGILYTLKCLIFNPGNTIRSFISGKRVLHYNIFALFIIVIATKTLIEYQSNDPHIFNSIASEKHGTDETINEALDHYYKFFYLLAIPILSIFSYLFSKKLNYNYTEHIVFNCFLLTGGFFYALLVSLFGFLTGIYTDKVGVIFVFIYILFGYYQATRGVYTFWGYLWRILSIILLFIVALLLILAGIILVFYNGSFTGSIMF